ncbi:MAG: acetyl-CoA hydrolase/transferase C-terminal domain-containing protein, partial [Candidatus Bathyarchaeia archaeon]
TPRHAVQYVLTKYSITEIWLTSLRERAKALIDIAHPKFRDYLLKEAERLF